MSQEHLDPHLMHDPPKPVSRAGRDLPAAIAVGVGLLAAVVVTLGWFHWGFTLLVAVALSFAAHELYQALKRIGMTAAIWPIIIGTVAIQVASYYVSLNPDRGLGAAPTLLALLSLTVIASLIFRLRGGPQGFVKDAAASLFIVAYVSLLGAAVPLMLGGEQGKERVIAFIVCVAANDTGGYVAGVLFGKHKMAPVISPKKTWEGLAGSVVFAVGVGVLMAMWLLGASWWVGVVLGLAMVAFGTCGDLIESMIKRDVGIKDMSSFLPGHGGVMDRLDSLLVAAPVAWLVLYLTVPGG
ncbi:phosphatidate cytidylyltransferase [Propionibacteriaceae bacterium G57]|uniref:phosphatidate cytidylyltransferase n=1 Tax=Aestuariimicrobium sp. G57 TaxID=3418485 RepID=UPI003DA6E4F5